MSANPAFSVIITCFNDGPYLDEAIQSVVQSTLQPVEIIVVDDCSTDEMTRNTLNRVEQSGYPVIRLTTNGGVGNARNKGIAAAHAEYILTLDGDDRILPVYLERAAAVFEKYPSVSVVYSNVKRFGAKDTIRTAPDFELPLLLAGNFISSCSAFRKSAWAQTPGYDTQMPNYEDWEFWIQLASLGHGFYHIDEIMFEYRARATSKINRVNNPEHRANVVQYVCSKHHELYKEHVAYIVPYLHKVISSNESLLENQEQLFATEGISGVLEKLRYAEDELIRRTAYYENSVFWKLKKLADIFKPR